MNTPPNDEHDLRGSPVSLSSGNTDANVTWSATGLPPGSVSIGALGLISGTVGATANGVYPVVVTATDDGVSSTFGFTWTVGPLLNSISPSAEPEDFGTFTMTLNGVDLLNAGAATVTVNNGPALTNLTPLSGSTSTALMVAIPGALLHQPLGTNTITVSVTSGSGSGVVSSNIQLFTVLALKRLPGHQLSGH